MMMTTVNFLTKGSLLEFGEIYTQHHRKGDKLFGLVFMVKQVKLLMALPDLVLLFKIKDVFLM